MDSTEACHEGSENQQHTVSDGKTMLDIASSLRTSTTSKRPILMLEDSEPRTAKLKLSVPATDSSWAACRVFLAAMFSEGLLFGICLSFGVFQDYYTNTANLPHNERSSWIGVLAAGIAYLGAPLGTYCCQTFNIARHYYIYGGWVLCLAALLSSAFCHSVTSLIFTQGLLLGLGLLIVEMPTLLILNSWFIKRRGLAYGILYGMTDLFGVGWGFLANALLHKHGIRTTFLILTGICFVVPGLSLCFLRERPSTIDDVGSETSSLEYVPGAVPREKETTPVLTKKRYYRHATFYILLASNLCHSFAFYLPFIYLPSYTTALGHPSSTGAVVLAVANVAQVFGEVGFGRLSDKAGVHTLVFCSAIASSLSAFFIWGFATSLAYIIPFALLFGAFGSGFLVLWPRMGTMYGEKDASMIYSIMSFGRGLGILASGPISTTLLQNSHGLKGRPLGSIKHDFRPVVMFVGACMAVSALLGLVGCLLSHRKSEQPPHVMTETNV